jgi:hypothetical protein
MTTSIERRQDAAVIGDSPRARASAVARGARPMNAALLFTVVALSIMVVGLLYLIQTAQVASLGYELTRLERERATAALANQRLTYTVANYESLPAIERIAIDTRNMQPASDYAFIVVPLPPRDQLQLPPAPEQAEMSLGRRVWERLTGQSTATNAGGGR